MKISISLNPAMISQLDERDLGHGRSEVINRALRRLFAQARSYGPSARHKAATDWEALVEAAGQTDDPGALATIAAKIYPTQPALRHALEDEAEREAVARKRRGGQDAVEKAQG